MERFHIWWLRAGKARWVLFILVGNLLLAFIKDWLLGDTIEFISSHLGVDMNIVEVILAKPITLIAILFLIGILVWIWKVGSKGSALYELHNKLLTIREINKAIVINAIPVLLAKHNEEMDRETWLLVSQELNKRRKHKTSDITAEELSNMRIQRLVPENTELEEIKRQNKELGKLWGKVSSLQTAIIDNILDKRIARLRRMIALSDAYFVYKEVISKLYILNLNDYGELNKPVKITRDALDEAHDMVNRRISLLLHNKETIKEEQLAREVKR